MNSQLHQTDQQRTDLPRIELEFPVTISLHDGREIHVYGHNISRGGMGIACDGSTARTMVTEGSTVSPDAGAIIHVRWELPDMASSTNARPRWTLHARAKLAWSRPAGTNGHRIGLQYTELDGDVEQGLSAFIESAMM